MIRDVTLADAAAICEIYNHYVTDTIVTFEETPVSVDQMQNRITSATASYPWLVFAQDDRVMGYAYVGEFRNRSAYRHTVECTIYLHADAVGKGIGKVLFSALLDRVRQTSIHTVVGCISLPNDPSVRLHEQFGFEQVAHFKETGYKFDQWIDVGYWQLLLV